MTKRHKKRKSRARHPNGLPKGAYPLPTGGYVSSSTYRSARTGRVLHIRAVHRADIDSKAVAQVVVAIAVERARADHDKH